MRNRDRIASILLLAVALLAVCFAGCISRDPRKQWVGQWYDEGDSYGTWTFKSDGEWAQVLYMGMSEAKSNGVYSVDKTTFRLITHQWNKPTTMRTGTWESFGDRLILYFDPSSSTNVVVLHRRN